MTINELSINQFFTITDNNNSNIKGLSLFQSFIIFENFDTQVSVLNLTQTFNLAQSISLNRVINLTVNQNIPLYQKDSKIAAEETVIQVFYAWQQILKTPVGNVNQLFNILQTVIGIDTTGVINTLVFNEQFLYNRFTDISVNQTIDFIQGSFGTIGETCKSLITFTLDGPNSSGGNVF